MSVHTQVHTHTFTQTQTSMASHCNIEKLSLMSMLYWPIMFVQWQVSIHSFIYSFQIYNSILTSQTTAICVIQFRLVRISNVRYLKHHYDYSTPNSCVWRLVSTKWSSHTTKLHSQLHLSIITYSRNGICPGLCLSNIL